MADLDSILSGQGAVASEPEAETNIPAVETPEVETEQPETEGNEGEQGQKMVPQQALHAEKQKVKRYTEQVADFERKMTERETAWERRFTQLLETVKPKPVEAPKPKPEIWENPDEFVQSGVQAALSPYQAEVQKTLHGIAKDAAYGRYGEAVDAAEQAFMQAVQGGTVDAADYEKVLKAPNRYSAAVEWHKREQERAEFADPAALREKLKAEILAELQGGTQQQQAAPVMPTNLAGARNVGTRSGPAWSGPASLNDIFDRRPAKG